MHVPHPIAEGALHGWPSSPSSFSWVRATDLPLLTPQRPFFGTLQHRQPQNRTADGLGQQYVPLGPLEGDRSRMAPLLLNTRQLEPSRSLTWHRCYDDGYDCARLDVPMDWLDPSDGDRVVLAVMRLRATNMTDYRGPTFFNPGGPGGSGIWSMLDHGKHIQTIVGANHDIVTFDPRGVGASVPRIECWRSRQERTFWGLAEVGVSDSHPGVLYDEYARAAAVSSRCEAALAKSGILRHISTASHARDMLEILNQMGHDRLKYWGFSYGTILGGTFAAMYPDKVERLVSDGNVDYNEWYRGVHINFPRDADKVLDSFYNLCSQAGPIKCAFYEASPAKVETRFRNLLERLRERPVVVPAKAGDDDDGPEMPQIVSYSSLRRMLSSVLYQPLYLFPEFARVLAALEVGNGLPFLRMAGARHSSPFESFCPSGPNPIEPTVPPSSIAEDTEDVFPAVMCADSEPWGNKTARDFALVAEELHNVSFAIGAVSSVIKSACVGRLVRPKWRFTDTFQVKTRFPVLFIANTADNVTPLVSARNNSEGFEGSVVLVQNSYGHTTLAAPSACTAARIRAYFQEGLLPPPGAECEADRQPFGEYVGKSASGELASMIAPQDVTDLAHAVLELSQKASARLWRRRF
ncbi:hypothetical protein RB595_001810 [Gaeumannomyces hyphopodioides]